MPFYEVKVTCIKNVCVKADNENEAECIAADEFIGDFRLTEGDVVDEYHEDNPFHMELVQQYKDEHEYYE